MMMAVSNRTSAMTANPAIERDVHKLALAVPSAFGCPSRQTLSVRFSLEPRAATGRFATDTSPDSSPESHRWTFASRKLPFADESCRPVAAVELSGKLSFNAAAQPASRR